MAGNLRPHGAIVEDQLPLRMMFWMRMEML